MPRYGGPEHSRQAGRAAGIPRARRCLDHARRASHLRPHHRYLQSVLQHLRAFAIVVNIVKYNVPLSLFRKFPMLFRFVFLSQSRIGFCNQFVKLTSGRFLIQRSLQF